MEEPSFQYTIVEDQDLPAELCNEFFLNEEDLAKHSQCVSFESDELERQESSRDGNGRNDGSNVTELYKDVEPLDTIKCSKDNNGNILNDETSNFQDRELYFVESNLSSDEGPFICIICEQTFQSPLQYSSHMKSHTGEKPHQCSICLIQFDFKSALSMHLKRKHNICQADFQCNICEKKFDSSAQLNRHDKCHCSKGSNCAVCGQTFRNKRNMMTHMLSHVTTNHLPEDPQSKNEMQRLPYLLELKHIFQAHGLFQCFQCKLLFPSLSCLEQHTLKEHGIDTSEIHANLVLNDESCIESHESAAEDLYKTSEFKLNDTDPVDLSPTANSVTARQEMQSLSNNADSFTEKSICNGVSNSNSLDRWKACDEDLNRDVAKADSSDCYCPICKKSISSRSNLKVHVMTHTGEQPHVCPYPGCGKKFTQRSPLQRHMAIHSGKKPWLCGTCGKSFTRQDDLVTHIRVHTGEKPYKCRECGKNFSQRGSLLTHRKMHARRREEEDKKEISA